MALNLLRPCHPLPIRIQLLACILVWALKTISHDFGIAHPAQGLLSSSGIYCQGDVHAGSEDDFSWFWNCASVLIKQRHERFLMTMELHTLFRACCHLLSLGQGDLHVGSAEDFSWFWMPFTSLTGGHPALAHGAARDRLPWAIDVDSSFVVNIGC
jgi:hypothetical protein